MLQHKTWQWKGPLFFINRPPPPLFNGDRRNASQLTVRACVHSRPTRPTSAPPPPPPPHTPFFPFTVTPGQGGVPIQLCVNVSVAHDATTRSFNLLKETIDNTHALRGPPSNHCNSKPYVLHLFYSIRTGDLRARNAFYPDFYQCKPHCRSRLTLSRSAAEWSRCLIVCLIVCLSLLLLHCMPVGCWTKQMCDFRLIVLVVCVFLCQTSNLTLRLAVELNRCVFMFHFWVFVVFHLFLFRFVFSMPDLRFMVSGYWTKINRCATDSCVVFSGICFCLLFTFHAKAVISPPPPPPPHTHTHRASTTTISATELERWLHVLQVGQQAQQKTVTCGTASINSSDLNYEYRIRIRLCKTADFCHKTFYKEKKDKKKKTNSTAVTTSKAAKLYACMWFMISFSKSSRSAFSGSGNGSHYKLAFKRSLGLSVPAASHRWKLELINGPHWITAKHPLGFIEHPTAKVTPRISLRNCRLHG